VIKGTPRRFTSRRRAGRYQLVWRVGGPQPRSDHSKQTRFQLQSKIEATGFAISQYHGLVICRGEVFSFIKGRQIYYHYNYDYYYKYYYYYYYHHHHHYYYYYKYYYYHYHYY